MIIENFEQFKGQHCETTATGCLLKQIGIHLSEPMLFGIGEGLGFIFWYMKTMDSPFIGGRIKPDFLTENICSNLKLKLEVTETASKKKAWQNITTSIEKEKAVGLKLDCYHLEYFTNKIHFAGHYVALYGYDPDFAYLVDTDSQGGKVKTSLHSLELARNEKGPMSSKNRSYTISQNEETFDLVEVIKKALYNNALTFLNPPIKNMGYKGILKTSSEIKKWFQNSKSIKNEFQLTAMLMEKAGTGGSLFRQMYQDFLEESYALIGSTEIKRAYQDYLEIAPLWKQVSELFHMAGETENVEYIDQASQILIKLSEKEKTAMERLINAFKIR